MNNVENKIDRMKAMMNYGKSSDKKSQYNSIEYVNEGADGKTYGIVREGTKYYFKVSDKKNANLKEYFYYIGGFRNRKDFEYISYANALKNFQMKMMSIKEAYDNRDNLMVESWNLDRKEELTVEATEKMKKEIARQRQIMGNAAIIQEKKNYTVNLNEACCDKVDKECASTQKDNIKDKKDGKGEPTGNGGDPFTQSAESEMAKTQKTNTKKEYKPVMNEGEQVLGWNDNEDYLDTSKGTEVGDDAPFTECEGTEKELDNGTVEEGVAMHTQGENQNSPAVGVGEIGDDAPFDEKAKNELQESINEEFDGEEEPIDDEEVEFDGEEEPMDDEEVDFDGEEEPEFGEEEVEEVSEEDDLEARISSIEDMLSKIAEKLGVDAFEDDSLYGDDEVEDSEDEEFEFEMDDEIGDEDDFETEEDDFEVYETVNYRKAMMNEDRLDYFGKHPAYRKEPMELPSNKHKEMPEYYDMNDESVESEQPFGQQIGDSAPFDIDPNTIENAIAESIKKIFKKKI